MRKRIINILFLLFSIFLVGCENEIKRYTVNFYDGEILLKTEEVSNGSFATAPEIVVKEGYNFIGWDQEFYEIRSDLNVNAIFEIKTFTVKFYLFNEVIYEEVVEYNENATPPEDPQVDGMFFAGWLGDYTNVKSDITIHANITSIPIYTVRFLDGVTGEVLKKAYLRHGQSTDAPDVDDTKVGYKFNQWSEVAQNVSSDLDITALYDEVTETYTITKDEYIVLNVDATGIRYNTQVTVTFNLPNDQAIDKFYVDNVETLLVGNSYTFLLRKNMKFHITLTGATSLQIFYLNDLHGSILENSSDLGSHEIGLAKIANFINQKRKENSNSIFIAGGDMLQGSALSNYYLGESTLNILEMMGLDVFVVGNHEFDWGIEEVTKHFKGNNPKYSFPLLAANIYNKNTGMLLEGTKPYHIIERGSIKVGIIGYIGQGLESSISASRVKDYEFRDPVPIVTHYASLLRETHGVNFVITVGHVGETHHNTEIQNLTGSSKIDLMFNAHTHRNYINIDGDKAPIIQSRANGIAVGYVEVDNISGVVSINRETMKNYLYYQSELFTTADSQIEAQIEFYREETDPIFKTTIIYNATKIDRYSFGEWLSKLMAIKTGSDAGVYNSGGIRDTLPAGNINIETLYKILPFDNMVKSAVLKGNYVDSEINNNPSYLNGVTISTSSYYRVVTNDYVFDYERGVYQRYGTDVILYDGNIRDWVIEEMRLQAAAGLTFSLDNEILSQIDPMIVRSDHYYAYTFI